MMPFQVDQSWYEDDWWRDPAPRGLSAFALFRRILWLLQLASRRDALADRQLPQPR